MKFFINCEQACLLGYKLEDGSLSFVEKVKLKIHMIICGWCTCFKDQSKTINKAFSKLYTEKKQQKNILNPDDKSAILRALEKE